MAESRELVPSCVKPPNAGKGRVKGVPNKVTGALRDMILTALDRAGGVEYLAEQAKANPIAFLALVAKILPLKVNGGGDDGQHIVEVRWTIHDS